ncbi:MAG: dihydrofolate reductase family protein [Proteobacteria bacterium]|nr:dihydrofolate reductase family protein [Pseudomonadota bacterium]
MKSIHYCVAMSLDGYIAGPNDEYDWILMDPDIDFESYMDRFDTYVMGRKAFEITGSGPSSECRTIVVSRTLKNADHPNITIIRDDLKNAIAELQKEADKNIWLFGGGQLFSSLLDLGLVDVVEVSIIPILLGSGVPFLQSRSEQTKLQLIKSRVYEKSGTVSLEYAVDRTA